MQNKSPKSSRPTKQKKSSTGERANRRAMAKAADAGLDRPIEAAVLKQARRIVADYQIVVINEDGEWYGHGLELPHVYGDGLSPGSCVENTRDALTAAVAHLLET